MYGDGGFRNFAPVKVGDELEVKIEAVGEKGDGIAKKDGFVLFVPNTKEGQEVRIRITKVLRKVGFAEVVGEGSAPAEDAPAEEQPAEQPASEDTEDFGEESPAEEVPQPPEEEKKAAEESEPVPKELAEKAEKPKKKSSKKKK